MFKKIIASVILASFLLVNVSSHIAYAQQNTWYYQDWTDWMGRVYDDQNPDEIFGERYTAAQVEWVIYGLFAFIINHVVGNVGIIGCLTREVAQQNGDYARCIPLIGDLVQNMIDNGLIVDNRTIINNPQGLADKTFQNPIQYIFSEERPISGIGYIRNSLAKFSLAKEVKAQGFGFEAASSIRLLWVAVRDLTYFLLIIMIVVMSFMIMFRFKISPQTVITVQSALPRIIIALILITFSYAIAGFLIDLLYVVIGLIAAVLSASNLFNPPGNPPWVAMYNSLAGVGLSHGLIGVMSFYTLIFAVTGFITLITTPVGAVLGPATGLIWVIILIILLIALLINIFKILWILTKTFIMTLLLIAVGPIYIVVGGFGGWMKNLASNLAIFAAIGPMLALSFLFLASALPDIPLLTDLISSAFPFRPNPQSLGNTPWAPPFLSMSNLNIVWLVGSFVIITLIPNVGNIIKSMVAGKPFGYGTAVGAALGTAFGIAAYPVQQAWGATTEARNKAFREMIATRSFRPIIEMFGGKK